MEKYIYYIEPDFVGTDEFFNTPNGNKEIYEKWCKEGKAKKYTIENFTKAFNDEHISDLGMIYYI